MLFFFCSTGINFDAYEDIPVETSCRDVPNPATNFEELNLPGPLMENIRRCKFSKPTPVQRYAIPIGIAGRDLMACAQVRRVRGPLVLSVRLYRESHLW
jgi:ATP-dependent RNA helicase DDX3X